MGEEKAKTAPDDAREQQQEAVDGRVEIYKRERVEFIETRTATEGGRSVVKKRIVRRIEMTRLAAAPAGNGHPEGDRAAVGDPIIAFEGVNKTERGEMTFPILREDGTLAATLDEAFALGDASFEQFKKKQAGLKIIQASIADARALKEARHGRTRR